MKQQKRTTIFKSYKSTNYFFSIQKKWHLWRVKWMKWASADVIWPMTRPRCYFSEWAHAEGGETVTLQGHGGYKTPKWKTILKTLFIWSVESGFRTSMVQMRMLKQKVTAEGETAEFIELRTIPIFCTFYQILFKVFFIFFNLCCHVRLPHLKVPRSTSCPLSRTWMPSLRRDPKAMYSPRAQSICRFFTRSSRPRRIRDTPGPTDRVIVNCLLLGCGKRCLHSLFYWRYSELLANFDS